MNGPQHDAWMTAIVNASSDAIISFTPNGTVLTWSCGAEAIFGTMLMKGSVDHCPFSPRLNSKRYTNTCFWPSSADRDEGTGSADRTLYSFAAYFLATIPLASRECNKTKMAQ
jgi:hypothetical protein